ncbi:MAG: DUF364 domain-containing protein [Pseudomonadota bacterium]
MTSLVADTLGPRGADHKAMIASPAGDRADPMSWAQAVRFLSEAGWTLRDLPGGEVMLAVTDGPDLGLLLETRPAPDAEIDGHGLLRAAGGGALDSVLADSVTATDTVEEVLVGFNWVFVRAGRYAGIARSPNRGTEGARTARPGEPIKGRPLRAMAGWLCSLDPLRRAIGLAAINAFWNTKDGPTAKDKWGLARFETPGDGLVIVGGFRAAMDRLPMAKIIEREPMGRDVPVDQAGRVLAEANAIAITAQTLMNGSLEPLLARAAHIPVRLLVGPSAPVAPVVLDHGLTAVSGLCITDPDTARSFIAETGTMIAMDHMTKPLEVAR